MVLSRGTVGLDRVRLPVREEVGGEAGGTVFATGTTTILVSIVAHGTTADPRTARLPRT